MTEKQITNNAEGKKVTFSIDAANAREVFVLGDFNRWQPRTHPLKKEKNGVWESRVVLQHGRHEYKFVVDGQWVCDPLNDQVCKNCFGTMNNVLDVYAG